MEKRQNDAASISAAITHEQTTKYGARRGETTNARAHTLSGRHCSSRLPFRDHVMNCFGVIRDNMAMKRETHTICSQHAWGPSLIGIRRKKGQILHHHDLTVSRRALQMAREPVLADPRPSDDVHRTRGLPWRSRGRGGNAHICGDPLVPAEVDAAAPVTSDARASTQSTRTLAP